jgi:iron complex outermembrane receptor protein
MINEDTSETIWKRNQIIAKATVNIIEGLTWNNNYSYNHRQSTYSSYHSHNTQLVPYNAYNGTANRNTYFGDDHTFETYLNFDRTFGKVHKLALMAGYSWEERNSNDGFGLEVHNFFDDYLKWNQLTYAGTIDGMPAVQSGTKETVRNISFYGRASYSFNSRYMVQATIRRDGSSVFGKDNRWGTFPSVSAAWNVTEEPFMQNQKVFDNLKLRLGYGVSGNALGFGAYSSVATYGATGSTFVYGGNSWAILGATKLANPDLKWESTGMFNVGIDYGFWNNRINGSIEFYSKKTKDLIWNYPVSEVIYSFDTIAANVGEITNKGVEFTINIDAIRTKNFNWMTTLNLAHNSNRVDKLSNEKYSTSTFPQGDPMVAGVSANGYTQRVIEGEPLGTFFVYEFAGYGTEGKATYYVRDANGNKTGETTSSPEYKDRYIAGNAQPKLNFGWNNTFSLKNWNLNLFFTGVLGNKIYNGSRAHYTAPDFFAGGKNVLKEFITDRPYSDNLSNIPSDRFIEKGDYLRLQTLSLGYTFTKLGDVLQSLQIYGTINNVFTITGYKGLDPEVNMGGIQPGVDFRWSNYPHTRTFLAGIRVNF